MNVEEEGLVSKAVTAADVDPSKIVLPEISPDIRELFRNSPNARLRELASLKGPELARHLIEQYWKRS